MQVLDRQSLADVLFAVVIIVALWAWNAAAHTAIIAAATCYLAVAGVRALATSETMRDVMIHRQSEVTARRANDNQVRIYRTQQIALPQSAGAPATESLPAPSYVPAVDPRTRVAAAEWVWGLYGDDNRINPSRVLGPRTKAPGQIQAGKPREEVVNLLTDAGLVRVGAGGMLFWTGDHCPTVHEALNKIQGRGAAREG